MKFKPLDLLAPWGICLGAGGLCVWGAIFGDIETHGRVICGITAAVFFSGIPLWYRFKGK